MKTKRTLLVAGGLSAMALSAALATAVDLQPLVVPRPDGTLHMVQSVPCDQLVTVDTDVSGGRIEMTPAMGLDVEGGKIFNLTRLTLFFKGFSVRGDCQGFRDTHKVTDIGVRLAGAVSFRAVQGDGGNYFVRIPKDQFLMTETFVDNREPKLFYMKPGEDVIGVVNLVNRTVRLRIVGAVQLLFRAGCTSLPRCLINELRDGTQTADIFGQIVFPQTAPSTAPQ